jgi:hypothetical protein
MQKAPTAGALDGGRTRDRTLDLSRVKAEPAVDITHFFVSASIPWKVPGFDVIIQVSAYQASARLRLVLRRQRLRRNHPDNCYS